MCDLENFDLNILDMVARVSNDGEMPLCHPSDSNHIPDSPNCNSSANTEDHEEHQSTGGDNNDNNRTPGDSLDSVETPGPRGVNMGKMVRLISAYKSLNTSGANNRNNKSSRTQTPTRSRSSPDGTAGVVLDIDVETGYVHVLWMEGNYLCLN